MGKLRYWLIIGSPYKKEPYYQTTHLSARKPVSTVRYVDRPSAGTFVRLYAGCPASRLRTSWWGLRQVALLYCASRPAHNPVARPTPNLPCRCSELRGRFTAYWRRNTRTTLSEPSHFLLFLCIDSLIQCYTSIKDPKAVSPVVGMLSIFSMTGLFSPQNSKGKKDLALLEFAISVSTWTKRSDTLIFCFPRIHLSMPPDLGWGTRETHARKQRTKNPGLTITFRTRPSNVGVSRIPCAVRK